MVKLANGNYGYAILGTGNKKEKSGFEKIGFVFNCLNVSFGKHRDGMFIHYDKTMRSWIIETEK